MILFVISKLTKHSDLSQSIKTQAKYKSSSLMMISTSLAHKGKLSINLCKKNKIIFFCVGCSLNQVWKQLTQGWEKNYTMTMEEYTRQIALMNIGVCFFLDILTKFDTMCGSLK